MTSLIRSLPKNLRVNFVPAPNKAREFLAAVPARRRAAAGRARAPLPLDHRRASCRARPGTGRKVPEHLRPTYRVVDESGAEQARGKDLEALKEPLRPTVRAGDGRGRRPTAGIARTGQTTWTFGTIEALVHPDPGRTRGARLPGPGRRGRHGRAAGVRLRGRGRGAAPARRTPAAAARARPDPVDRVARRPDQRREARPGRVAVPHRRGAARRLPRRRRRAPPSTPGRRCATRRRTPPCATAVGARPGGAAARACWPT